MLYGFTKISVIFQFHACFHEPTLSCRVRLASGVTSSGVSGVQRSRRAVELVRLHGMRYRSEDAQVLVLEKKIKEESPP